MTPWPAAPGRATWNLGTALTVNDGSGGPMRSLEKSALEDRIYEAAVVPERWPDVLQSLSDLSEAEGGLIFTANGQNTRWVASEGIVPAFRKYLREGWEDRNLFPVRMAALREAGFVSDQELFTEDEIRNDPFYQSFLRKNGLGYAAGTFIEIPSGDEIFITFERAFAKGPVTKPVIQHLNALRPHLARSTLLAARLGLERARTKTRTLQVLGLPAAVLDRQGRLIAANDLLNDLVPNVIQDRRPRLRLVDAAADVLFDASLEKLRRRGVAGAHSVPIAAGESHLPLIVHLVPIRGAARDIFSDVAALFVVTPVDKSVVPTAEVLQGLFDLSPAEARVARGIGDAQTVEALARSLGISRETVRTQLKAVLGKTGLHRQVELVSLLASKTPPFTQ